jgi:hypothetical protein
VVVGGGLVGWVLDGWVLNGVVVVGRTVVDELLDGVVVVGRTVVDGLLDGVVVVGRTVVDVAALVAELGAVERGADVVDASSELGERPERDESSESSNPEDPEDPEDPEPDEPSAPLDDAARPPAGKSEYEVTWSVATAPLVSELSCAVEPEPAGAAVSAPDGESPPVASPEPSSLGPTPGTTSSEPGSAALAEAPLSSVATAGEAFPEAHHAVSATDTTTACAASRYRFDLGRGRSRSLDIFLTKPSTPSDGNAPRVDTR